MERRVSLSFVSSLNTVVCLVNVCTILQQYNRAITGSSTHKRAFGSQNESCLSAYPQRAKSVTFKQYSLLTFVSRVDIGAQLNETLDVVQRRSVTKALV